MLTAGFLHSSFIIWRIVIKLSPMESSALTDSLAEPEHADLPHYSPPAGSDPKFILLISGKRKCGKDHIGTLIRKRVEDLGLSVGMIRMANPVKHDWAARHGATYEKLLDSSSYKEHHRPGMARLSVETRYKSVGYYPYHSILLDNAVGKTVWICPDMRHFQDIDWFLNYFPGITKRIRVEATEEVRTSRGFVFVEEIDLGPTECELDRPTWSWDHTIYNNGSDDSGVTVDLDTVLGWVQLSCN